MTIPNAITAALLVVVAACIAVAPTPSATAELYKDAVAAEQRGDHTETLRLLRPLADRGDTNAQVYLGYMSHKGLGVPQDFAAALAWYRKAAEQGNAMAEFSLGVMYDNGEGAPQDLAQAVAWYRKAADRGHARAQSQLCGMHSRGRGVPQDYDKAARLCRSAAEQDDADAAANLGWAYYNGHGVPQDLAQAVAWYRKAAEQGDATAEFSLGVIYDNGEGAPQDLAQAVAWYRKAADKGQAGAQAVLGSMYANGKGVPRDLAEALRWLRLGAAAGSEIARTQLARVEAKQTLELRRTEGQPSPHAVIASMDGSSTAGGPSVAQAQQQPQLRIGAARWRDLGNGMRFLYGLTQEELVAAYPDVKCSDSECGLPDTRQDLCPGGERCQTLELIMKEGRTVGFQGNYDFEGWQRLYLATQRKHGNPRQDYWPASDNFRISNNYSQWVLDIGNLTFRHADGVNAYGNPVGNPYSVWFAPRDRQPTEVAGFVETGLGGATTWGATPRPGLPAGRDRSVRSAPRPIARTANDRAGGLQDGTGHSITLVQTPDPPFVLAQARPSTILPSLVLPPSVTTNPPTFEAMMRLGDSAMVRGDIIRARALYERAATVHPASSAAALATGKTYDPNIQPIFGGNSVFADAAKAREWYERAQALGNPNAAGLLASLR